MNNNEEWLRKMGAKEDNQCISVGGLIHELAKKCVPIVFDVSLPLCWKKMVDVEFDAQDAAPRDAKNHRSGNADPEAYYDDVREVVVKLPGGSMVVIGLYSGQSNYYGGILIYDKEGNEIYNDIIETFEDVMECAVAMPIPTSPAHFGLSKYEIKINWE